MTKRDLPKYVYWQKGKGGTRYASFQRGKAKSVKMKHLPPTPEFYAEYTLLISGRPVVSASRRTFNTLILLYKDSQKWAKLAPRTRKDYEKCLLEIARNWGELDPATITPADVAFLRDNSKLTGRWANYLLSVLKRVMAHARAPLGWRNDNPVIGVDPVDYEREDRKPWPDELVAKFRDAANGQTLLLFELAVGTGQRIGDLLKMEWSDVAGDGIQITTNKTEAKLWLPLTPNLREALKRAPRGGKTIVTAMRSNDPWDYRTASKKVRDVREKIGALDYVFHEFRNTTACELAVAGCDDETIADAIGMSLETVKRYTRTVRQKARAQQAHKMRLEGKNG